MQKKVAQLEWLRRKKATGLKIIIRLVRNPFQKKRPFLTKDHLLASLSTDFDARI